MKTNSAWTLGLISLLAEFPSTNQNEFEVDLNLQYNLVRMLIVRDLYLKLKEKGLENLVTGDKITQESFETILLPFLQEVMPEDTLIKNIIGYVIKALTVLPVSHESDAVIVLSKIIVDLDGEGVISLLADACKTQRLANDSIVAKALVDNVSEEKFIKVAIADIEEQSQKESEIERLLEKFINQQTGE